MVLYKDPQVRKVVFSWSKGMFQSMLIALSAFFVAYLLHKYIKITPGFLLSFETTSLLLGACAVLGISDVVSWSRATPAEKLDKSFLIWTTRAALFFSIITISFWYLG